MRACVVFGSLYRPARETERLSVMTKLKLASMGVQIDTLTPSQKKYLASWQEGT